MEICLLKSHMVAVWINIEKPLVFVKVTVFQSVVSRKICFSNDQPAAGNGNIVFWKNSSLCTYSPSLSDRWAWGNNPFSVRYLRKKYLKAISKVYLNVSGKLANSQINCKGFEYPFRKRDSYNAVAKYLYMGTRNSCTFVKLCHCLFDRDFWNLCV